MKPKLAVHLCSFSALDELPKRLYGDDDAVFDAIKRAGRFSVFEVNYNARLASTVARLFKGGRLRSVLTDRTTYPWVMIEAGGD